MKVLMLLEHDFPGDVRVDREVETLFACGITVDVAIYKRNKNTPNIINYSWGNVYSKYIPKIVFKLSALALTFPVYFKFWELFIEKLLQNNSYDYIHLHDLPLIKVAHKLSKKYKIPLTVDLHENRPEIMKLYEHVNTFPGKFLISTKKWEKYQKRFINTVDSIILITEEAKNYYLKYLNVNGDKIYVVPNYIKLPVDFDDVDNEILNKIKNKITIVYFGDISIRRGVDDVMNLAILNKKNSLLHFLFIGNGSALGMLKKKKKENNLNNVDVLGFYPIKKALKLISESSVGICPFHRNIHHDTTYANKMFQYMALGLPLIVSDCTAQANLVKKENAGVVFQAGNVKDLNNKLTKLISDKDEFNKISKKVITLVEKKYNWSIASKELLKIYKG